MAIPFMHRTIRLRRGPGGFLILVLALIAFELFNFSTTEYALQGFFGAQQALGVANWATILAVAFCAIDFAGLSRLFTPGTSWRREPREVWLLTLAWLLGTAMNAIMTWWAVASTLSENPALGNEVLSRARLLRDVPILVAGLVWLTRVMLIASLASSGDRLLNLAGGGRTVESSARPLGSTRTSALPGGSPSREYGDRSRASSVRSIPGPQPAATSGAPIGSYGRRASTTEELSYVDLD